MPDRIGSRVQFIKKQQIKQVSSDRYTDARVLLRHQRYNAAIYLGGFVIECLLKCSLWDLRSNPKINRLLYTSHNFEDLLEANSLLFQKLRTEVAIFNAFSNIMGWSVTIRYMSKRVSRDGAHQFMKNMGEVRLWLLRHV